MVEGAGERGVGQREVGERQGKGGTQHLTRTGVLICMLLLGLATTEEEGLVRGQPSSEGSWETPAMSPLG